MLIRILGEGQFVVPDSELDEINRLDRELEVALDGSAEGFRAALDALLARVRELGTRPAEDLLEESEVILPFADASEEEIRGMLSGEGLIPG